MTDNDAYFDAVFGATPERNEEMQQQQLDERVYNLFSPDGKKKSRERIRVYRADGSSYSVSYGDIDQIELSQDATLLSILLRTGSAWHVKGEGLHLLAAYLDEHRVAKLYAYDPQMHVLPKDTAPHCLIHMIDIVDYTNRPALVVGKPPAR